MLLVEYPWLLSREMKTSMRNNIVGGPAYRQAGTAVFRPQSNSFYKLLKIRYTNRSTLKRLEVSYV